MERVLSLFGLLVFMGIAWALSTNRRAIHLRTVFWGLTLQFLLALFVLKTPFGQDLFAWVGEKITRVLELSFVGSEFVFGKLGAKGGGHGEIGFVFAFQVLPTIIFVSAVFQRLNASLQLIVLPAASCP